MDAVDGTYAPQSPDLSAFFEAPPKTQQAYKPGPSSISSFSSYRPQSPSLSFSGAPSQYIQQQHNTYAYSPQAAFVNHNKNLDYNNQYLPIPDLPVAHSFTNTPTSATIYLSAQTQQPPQLAQINNSPLTTTTNTKSTTKSTTMSSRGPRIKPDSSLLSTPSSYKDPNPLNIDIKTKFPVARIKRIMQADEEVGKVAQVTPVAVSKALELFMIALVGGAAEVAREKGQKRVTAQHLKQVVLGSEQFDFLTDIVGRVADVQEGAGGEGRKKKGKEVKGEEGSESSEEEKKPKKRGGGRKKKSDD